MRLIFRRKDEKKKTFNYSIATADIVCGLSGRYHNVCPCTLCQWGNACSLSPFFCQPQPYRGADSHVCSCYPFCGYGTGICRYDRTVPTGAVCFELSSQTYFLSITSHPMCKSSRSAVLGLIERTIGKRT